MKKHKLTCTKLGNKFCCDVCGKGFTQKSYCDQHFDFYHTNKPKKFVCALCKKSFPLKKTLQEHNQILHNEGDFKFVCDICRRGFFVKGEYKCHHIGHTDVKPYACGVCGEAKFASTGQLNAIYRGVVNPINLNVRFAIKHTVQIKITLFMSEKSTKKIHLKKLLGNVHCVKALFIHQKEDTTNIYKHLIVLVITVKNWKKNF